MKVNAMERIGVFAVLGLALFVLWCEMSVEAQVVVAERKQAPLGSVLIDDHKVSVVIAYQADSALLAAVVPGNDGNPRYIPLIGSTYRGVPSFRIDVLSPNSGDEMWIRMYRPRSEVLAHYRFGAETALTPFGRVKLLETLFPKHLSGGPVQFPKKGADAALPRASFYHYDDM